MKNKEIKQELNKLTISSPGICPKETALLISHLLAQQEKRLSKEMTGAILMSKQGWCEQGRADLLKEFRGNFIKNGDNGCPQPIIHILSSF